MYNPQDSIDTAYNYIQGLRAKGHSYGGYPVYNVSKSDLNELMRITDKYGIPFEWMVNLINHESARTFNPAITNSIGATGLIQFLKSTAIGLGTTTDELRKMTFKQQLVYVDKFLYGNLKRHLTPDGKIPKTFTQGDIFMAIFTPAAIGKPDYIFSNATQQSNSGIRTPMDYTQRALSSAVFPLSAFPYTLSDFNKKFGAVMELQMKILPYVIVVLGLAGLAYYLIASGKVKVK